MCSNIGVSILLGDFFLQLAFCKTYARITPIDKRFFSATDTSTSFK